MASIALDDQADFESWVRAELASSPLAEQGFATLLDRAATILCRIRSRLAEPGRDRGKAVWQRLMKNGRMLKEVNEVLPIAARVLQWVDELRPSLTDTGPITIIDLCSGVGYLSMLLSELLEASGPDIVARFVLVDDAWPRADHVGPPNPHHINPEHLNSGIWSHALLCRRCDFKSSYGHRELAQHVLTRAPGPVAVLGVHLCSLLSIRAVQLYNDHPRCCFLALKPCCLPDSLLARRDYAWQIGGHEFEAADVCGSGNNRYLRGKWHGNSPKELERGAFQRWCDNLVAGVDIRSGGTKELTNYRLVSGVATEVSEQKSVSTVTEDDGDLVDEADEGQGDDPAVPQKAVDLSTAVDGTGANTDVKAIERPGDGAQAGVQTGSGHSRHRYQTSFIFAQRKYSAEVGVVSKIGGGPEEQFWRSKQAPVDI